MTEPTTAATARCGTLVLITLLSFGQAGAQTPQSAQEWVERFESQGLLVSGISRVIFPCDGGNPLGPATLDLLLAKLPNDPQVKDLALLFHRSWERCPDPRIDRWLADALFLALTAERDPYLAGAIMYAIRQRSAPSEYQPWRQLAFDPNMPMDAREAAMYTLRGGMSASERVELFVELLQSPARSDYFLAVESRDLLRSDPSAFVAGLDARILLEGPTGLVGDLRRFAADGASPAARAAARLLREAEELAPPDRRWLFRPGG
jgi:hypothetical protein